MKDTNIRIPLYVALALAIALAACQPGKATELREQALVAAPGQPNLIGTAYAQYLVGMIVRSERIVVSEHSDAYDGVTGNGPAKPVLDYTARHAEKTILSVGLTTDRDWDKYALAHEKNLNK